jgi:two-component system, NarL family, sensor kinase
MHLLPSLIATGLILLASFQQGFSQGIINIDSLVAALNKTKPDTTILQSKLALLQSLETDQLETKKILADWIIKNSGTSPLSEIQAKTNIAFGIALLDAGNYTEAIKYITEGENIAAQNGHFKIQAQAYNEMANMYHDNKQISKAVEYYQKSIALNTKKKFLRGAAIARYNLGGMLLEEGYTNRDTVRMSLDMVMEALRAVKQLKDTESIITLSSGITQAYTDYGDLDSALIIIKEAGRLIKLTGNEEGYVTNYIRIAKVYNDQKKYSEAIANYKMGLEYALKYKQPRWVYNYYTGMAETYESMGDFEQANYYNKAYSRVRDSLINKENFTAAADIQNKYEREKKARELAQLTAENNKKTTLNKILIGSACALLIIGFLGYRNFKNRQQLQQAKITELEKDKQLMAVDAMLQGQEAERSRIAKDLHDGLGGMLSGVKLSFVNMKENMVMTPESVTAFENSILQLDATITELRKVAHNLMPEALVKFGLKNALLDYCNTMQLSSKVRIGYEQLGTERELGNTTDLNIYRIIQELISNAIKHGNPSKIMVQLTKTNNKILLTVEDDGKGFSKTQATTKDGMGIKSVQQRVDYFNGNMDIDTAAGNGTSINIELYA